MTSTHRFGSLAATQRGRTDQITRAYLGAAEELKHKQEAVKTVPMTPFQYECLITDLRQQLADARHIINEMRDQANSDAPAVVTGKYEDSKTVARRSGVAVCTICRNADSLGGMKLGGDWLFPAGTTYGKKRERKAK